MKAEDYFTSHEEHQEELQKMKFFISASLGTERKNFLYLARGLSFVGGRLYFNTDP